jgi:hypothetical protein
MEWHMANKILVAENSSGREELERHSILVILNRK